MSLCKSSGIAIFAALCLLCETTGLAHAQSHATEWSDGSVINLEGLPGTTISEADGINNLGQIVGSSGNVATEWTGGNVKNLGGLPGFTASAALAINNAGQAVGYSIVGGIFYATEWSGGSIIRLEGLSGYANSEATSINKAGQAVGTSYDDPGIEEDATEWSEGNVINLGGLSGSTGSVGIGINDNAQAVGYSLIGGEHATEWSGGGIMDLGGLPGSSFSIADGINNLGQTAGEDGVDGADFAVKWSDGNIINLGGSTFFNAASDINNAGQAVGESEVGGIIEATEWTEGNIINLEGLPGFTTSDALAINDAGQAVGYSDIPSVIPVPEPSTWTMMLLGFAGLAFAGYRRAKPSRATVARARGRPHLGPRRRGFDACRRHWRSCAPNPQDADFARHAVAGPRSHRPRQAPQTGAGGLLCPRKRSGPTSRFAFSRGSPPSDPFQSRRYFFGEGVEGLLRLETTPYGAEMCRGLGKVQRSILALIEAQPDEAWPVRDVAEQIYPGCAKPTRPQIDAVARALKTMRPPGKWKVGYVQGDRRRWLYGDLEAVARRMWRLETFEIEVEPVARGELVQAMDGTWFELHELEEVRTELILHDLSEIEVEVVPTDLADDDVDTRPKPDDAA